MGHAAQLGTLVATTLAAVACGGETIDRFAVGHAPPTKVDKDAGTDAGTAPPPAPFEVESSRGGTRLTIAETYSTDDPAFWDQEKKTVCRMGMASDGTMRCLPNFGFN